MSERLKAAIIAAIPDFIRDMAFILLGMALAVGALLYSGALTWGVLFH